MVCGGSVRVHYHYLPWEDAKSSAVEEEAGKRLESGKEIWLVRDLLADQGGMLRVCERTELPEEIGNVCGRKLILQETEGRLYCFERVAGRERFTFSEADMYPRHWCPCFQR